MTGWRWSTVPLPRLLLCMSTSTGEYTQLSQKTLTAKDVPCILPHFFGEDTLIEALKLFFGEQKNEFDASYPVVIKRGTNMQGEKIIYLLNYSDDEQTVTCHADGLKKLCDDSTVSAGDCIALAPWDFSILYAD